MNKNTFRLLDKYRLPTSNTQYLIYVGLDGESWYAMLGNDLEDGHCGFGNTIPEALTDLSNQLKSV
jgi:hypothetical protein